MFAATTAVVLFAGSLPAADQRGRVKSVDAAKGTITITVGRGGDAKEMTFKVAKDAKFTTTNKTIADKLATEGLKHEVFTKTGRMAARVTLVIEGEGDKAEVKEVKVGGGRRPRRPQQ
jgi:hypothetical protein